MSYQRGRNLDRLFTATALICLVAFGLIGGLVLARIFGGI